MAKNKLTFEQWVNTSTYPNTNTPIVKTDRRNREYFNKYEKKVEEASSDAQAKKIAEAHGQKAVTVKEEPTTKEEEETKEHVGKIRGANKTQKDKGKVFHGTNIPTAGYSKEDIDSFNARLKADINDGNMRSANDLIFSIAYHQGGGQNNDKVGAVQSGIWKLDKGPLWAEQYINSANDEYRLRNPNTGKLTGKVIRFSDVKGVLEGTPEVKSVSRGKIGDESLTGKGGLLSEVDLTAGLEGTGEWGGNPRAGIVAGQPTANVAGTVDWKSFGDDPGWETYFATNPSLGRARVLNPKEGSPQYTGTPTYKTGSTTQTGAGGSGEYLATPYTRPALQDWSHLAAPRGPGLLGSAPAQLALQRDNMANLQPWAQGGVLDYAPRGGSTWAPRTYSANPLDNSAAAAAAAAASGDNGKTYGPGGTYDNYQDWYMAPENPAGHYWALANAARA